MKSLRPKHGSNTYVLYGNHQALCRNPSFGLATKAKGIARVQAWELNQKEA
jgi:hypothetical protein